MKIGEAIAWGVTDIFAMAAIVVFIRLIYQKRYETQIQSIIIFKNILCYG